MVLTNKDINHFVDNELFAVDSKAICTYINESVPDIDLTFEFVSRRPKKREKRNFLWMSGFFAFRMIIESIYTLKFLTSSIMEMVDSHIPMFITSQFGRNFYVQNN